MKNDYNDFENNELSNLNLNKDEVSEQIHMHNALDQFHDRTLSPNFNNTLIKKINLNRRNILIGQLRAVAIILLAVGFFLFTAQTNTPKKEPNKAIDLVNKSLESSKKIKEKKYYAIYFSSALCKTCVNFLDEIAKFKKEHSNKSGDFEIIFINTGFRNELGKNPSKNLVTVSYKDLEEKKYFNDLRAGDGPAFLILDKYGKVITKHKKGVHPIKKSNHFRQNSFQTVLSQFNDLIEKNS